MNSGSTPSKSNDIQSTTPFYTYWYMFPPEVSIDVLKKAGGLLPVDRLSSERQAVYARDGRTPKQYFKEVYTKFYEVVLKKPYSHYGIYTTPLDLRGHRDLHVRIRFDANVLKPLVVHLYSTGYIPRKTPKRTICELWNPQVHTQLMDAFKQSIVDTVMTTVHEKVFRFLPQFVYFGDVPLTFTDDQIETF